LTPTRSRQGAIRWCTGYVQNVPEASHICLRHNHLPGLATILVAPAVTAGRLASATRCSHCTLRWLQSMTLPGTVLDLSRFCQAPGKWPSGRMQVGTPGNKVHFNVPPQAGKASNEHLSGRGLSSRRALTCFEGALLMDCSSLVSVLSLDM